MKILQVIPYFWPALSFGGPSKVVYELSKELSKRNKVTVYTSDAWDSTRRIKKSEKIKSTKNFKILYFENLVNLFALKFRFYTNFGIVFNYLKEKNEFDVVNINDIFSLPQIILAKIARAYSKSYVVSTHGVDISGRRRKTFVKEILYKLFVKDMLNNARSLIATSEGEKRILEKLGFKNVKVVFNGLSKLSTDSSQKFSKYSDVKKLSLLYIGRINKLKGIAKLVRGMSRLNFPLQLFIAGPDDGDKENIEKLVKKYNLRKEVHFLGFVNESEKTELYNISDLFVYPSSLEGFSISILEAMQHSLPVLITKACNFPDVEKYDAGVILSQRGLSSKISEILTDSYTRRGKLKKMGENAKKLVSRKYSIKKMSVSMERIYKKST